MEESQGFKPGDLVHFRGISDPLGVFGPLPNPPPQPVTGELFLNDSNTTTPRVMSIRGDKQRMIFLADGTIYCHPRFGCVLERVVSEPEVKQLELFTQELNKPLEEK